MARINKKGRTTKAGRFAALPHRVLISSAYGSLDLTARALLLELVMLENGKNNGSLWLSVRDATDRLGLSDFHAINRAFSDLRERKLIELTKDAHFTVKAAETSRARCWRICWLVWPEGPRNRRAPCWDFESYQIPTGSALQARKARKRVLTRNEAMERWRKAQSENRLPVVNFTTTESEMTQNAPATVGDSTTANSESDAKPPFSVVGDSTAHTDVTRGSGFSAWWMSKSEANLTGQIMALTSLKHSPKKLGAFAERKAA